MTAQIHDTFEQDGLWYEIVGVSGEGLFDPWAHGLPLGPCSACWRGAYAHYGLDGDGQLMLNDVGTWPRGPRLAGLFHRPTDAVLGVPRRLGRLPHRDHLPSPQPMPHFQAVLYEGIRLPIGFDGSLLVGRELLAGGWVRIGFRPPWSYRQVWKLTFENGRLVARDDRSHRARAMRQQFRRGEPRNPHRNGRAPPAHPSAPGAGLQRCFSLDYRW